MPHPRLVVALALATGLAGCVEMPDLGTYAPSGLDSRPYPALVPLDGVAPVSAEEWEDAQQAQAALNWRRDRLKARAAALAARSDDSDEE